MITLLYEVGGSVVSIGTCCGVESPGFELHSWLQATEATGCVCRSWLRKQYFVDKSVLWCSECGQGLQNVRAQEHNDM
jgi:hypothetical protein